MKHRLAKALVVAKIKETYKTKPRTWDSHKGGAWDRRPHKAGGGPVTDPDILSQLNGDSGKAVTDPDILSQLNGEPKSFGDRLSNMWEKATPGGPLWMAKQAVEGIKGAVEGSEAAVSPEPTTEEGAAQRNQLIDRGPGAAMQAASVLPVGVPGGTGGLLGAPIGAAEKAAAPAIPEAIAQTSAAASERLGVPISKAAVSESPTVQSSAAALKEVPFVGSPLVKSAKQTLQGLDTAAKDTAASYGSGDAVTAGEAAKEGLEDWITGKSGDIAKRVYGKVDDMVDPDFTRPLHSTSDTVADIMAKRANSRISGTSPAVNEVQEAISDPAGLNYEGVKGLRTYIRDMTPQEMTAKGINPQEAKRIYNSLTEDLRGTILDGGGPQALSAFDKANGIYSQIAERRAGLSKIIGVKADAAPERVMERLMQLAGSKGNADQSKLIQARRAIGPEKWNEVTSAVVNRMGRAAPAADFSGDRFVTAWNNMSDSGKRVLFNSTGKPELAKNVEDIMTLSQSYKQLAKMGNPSGTGRVNAIMSAMGALGGALAGTVTIGLAAPLTMLGSVLGGRGVAQVLARPVTAKSAADWSRAYVAAVKKTTPGTVKVLERASNALMSDIKRYMPAGSTVSVPAAAQDKQDHTQGVGQ